MTVIAADILTWGRRLLKTPNTQDISDATMLEYLNRFYIYDVPARIQLFDLKTQYSFETIANVDRYNLPIATYNLVESPVFCDGARIQMTQEPATLNAIYGLEYFNRDSASGLGIQGPYTFTLSDSPFIRGFTDVLGNLSPAVYITATDLAGNSLVVNDDGNGNLTGNGLGTVDYISGDISVTFNSTIPSTSPIRTQVIPYSAGKPVTMMFYNNILTLRSVPDRPYLITMSAYLTPSAFLSTNQSVTFAWMADYLAHGMARRILKDFGDVDQLQLYESFFREQELQVLRRTTRQNSTQRTPTIFSNQASSQWWY